MKNYKIPKGKSKATWPCWRLMRPLKPFNKGYSKVDIEHSFALGYGSLYYYDDSRRTNRLYGISLGLSRRQENSFSFVWTLNPKTDMFDVGFEYCFNGSDKIYQNLISIWGGVVRCQMSLSCVNGNAVISFEATCGDINGYGKIMGVIQNDPKMMIARGLQFNADPKFDIFIGVE